MGYKKSYYMLLIGIWSGAGMILIGGCLFSRLDAVMIGNLTALIGLMVMSGGIGQALIFYKCPDCGKRLNIRGRQADYCPRCGIKLDW